MSSSIKGAEDLAKQVQIKYGAVKGGSTIRFFQESNFSTYQVVINFFLNQFSRSVYEPKEF